MLRNSVKTHREAAILELTGTAYHELILSIVSRWLWLKPHGDTALCALIPRFKNIIFISYICV